MRSVSRFKAALVALEPAASLGPARGSVAQAPAAPGPIALVSMPANDELPPAAAGVAVFEGWAVGGARADCSTAMRATTDSILTKV